MDINALRVFDALYSLRISETEFGDLESEQEHTERTGLYVRCIKKGQAICVSHDQNHKIIIKPIKEGFPTPSRVLFKTVVTFDDLPQEIYTLHSIAQYRALDDDVKFRADNLEQLKDRVCDRFIDKKPTELGGYYEDCHYSELHCYDDEKREKWGNLKTQLIDAQLKALFWLFREDYSKFEKEVKVARNNISRILKVFERNNRRVAIIQKIEDYQKRRGGYMFCRVWFENIKGSRILIRTFKPSQPQYNYVDVNREMYLPTEHYEKAEIWLDDDLFERTGFQELKVLSKRLFNNQEEEEWVLLNADEFNKKQTLIRIEVMSAIRKEQEELAKNKLIKSIDIQFQKGKLIRQGITFTKNSIECEGVIVKNEKLGSFVMNNQIHLQQEPDFNKIVQNFICYILNIEAVQNPYSYKVLYECRFEGEENISIGKIKLNIKNDRNNIKINGHRICKDDLVEVIFNALTYTNQKKFDEYLKYSSTVNLYLQKALAKGGISFELKLDKTDDNSLSEIYDRYDKHEKMLLSLPLKREKNKNYVLIGGKEYKVQNLQALFDLGKEVNSVRIGYSGGGYLQRTIKLLYKGIKGITPKEIGNLIKNGQKEYEALQERVRIENAEKSKRADEFVAHAVKVSKAKKIDKGYLVKGISGKKYSVNADSLAVYEIQKGKQDRYVCIVDMGTQTDTEWGKKDALAKRLLMLAHDLKVAKEVHTLNLQEQLAFDVDEGVMGE